VHHGRVVKRTGDGSIVEFRSVVDAVNCAIEVQMAMVERNAEVALDKRIEFRIGIHLGDVVEESDGDLMGDGVNIAARIEGIAKPGGICISDDAYRQVKGRLDLGVPPDRIPRRPPCRRLSVARLGDDPAFVISAQSRSPGRSRNTRYRPLRPIRFRPWASRGAPSRLCGFCGARPACALDGSGRANPGLWRVWKGLAFRRAGAL
jgi:hypothetical protein